MPRSKASEVPLMRWMLEPTGTTSSIGFGRPWVIACYSHLMFWILENKNMFFFPSQWGFNVFSLISSHKCKQDLLKSSAAIACNVAMFMYEMSPFWGAKPILMKSCWTFPQAMLTSDLTLTHFIIFIVAGFMVAWSIEYLFQRCVYVLQPFPIETVWRNASTDGPVGSMNSQDEPFPTQLLLLFVRLKQLVNHDRRTIL